MYYNVPRRTGTILNAEAITPVKNYAGALRLRANVLRQVGMDQFIAEGASVTTSRLAMPTLRVSLRHARARRFANPGINPLTGLPVVDPQTGSPITSICKRSPARTTSCSSRECRCFIGRRLPPTARADVLYPEGRGQERQHLRHVDRDRMGHVPIARLAIIRPKDTDWALSLDYLSNRGPAAGTKFTLRTRLSLPPTGAHVRPLRRVVHRRRRPRYAGPGPHGLVVPEEEIRGRVLGRHRQELPNHWQLTAELGYISDRNFLEQFFEQEWDEQPDQRTGIELKQTLDNAALAIAVDTRINDFFMETEQLPRVDHFWIGQSLWHGPAYLVRAHQRRLLPAEPGQRAARSARRGDVWSSPVRSAGRRRARRHAAGARIAASTPAR